MEWFWKVFVFFGNHLTRLGKLSGRSGGLYIVLEVFQSSDTNGAIPYPARTCVLLLTDYCRMEQT